MEIIKSNQNSNIKKIKSLSQKKYRNKYNQYILEGDKVVLEAIKNKPEMIEFVAIKDGSKYTENHFKNLKSFVVESKLFEEINTTETSQNLLAVVSCKKVNITQCNAEKLLVLDHIQDPGNLGTIIRTAVATGFYDIVLINSVDAYNPKVVRSTSSAIFNVNLYDITFSEFINFRNLNNFKIITADMDGKNAFELSKTDIPKRFALVIGNEGNGISQDMFTNSDFTISLPMSKKIESLNAGVSASVLMYILTNLK